MKKSLKDLEVILLYLSKVKGGMGLDYYLVKNNLGFPEKTIPMNLSLPKPNTHDYVEKSCYVYIQLLDIIKSFSNEWKKVGMKKAKLVLNTQETAVSLDLDVNEKGNVYCVDTDQILPFDSEDIAFFRSVGLEAKLRSR